MHTLKGISGSVGAGELQAYAAQVERQLREAATIDELQLSPQTLIELIERSHEELRSFCDGLCANAPPAGAPVNADAAGATRILDELETLMKQRNMRAIQVFSGLKNRVPPSPVLQKAEAALNRLDFELALRHLSALRAALP